MKPLVIIFIFTLIVLIFTLAIIILKPAKPPAKKVIRKPEPRRQLPPPRAETSQRPLFKEPPPPAQLREDIRQLAFEDPALVARIIRKWLREGAPARLQQSMKIFRKQ